MQLDGTTLPARIILDAPPCQIERLMDRNDGVRVDAIVGDDDVLAGQ